MPVPQPLVELLQTPHGKAMLFAKAALLRAQQFVDVAVAQMLGNQLEPACIHAMHSKAMDVSLAMKDAQAIEGLDIVKDLGSRMIEAKRLAISSLESFLSRMPIPFPDNKMMLPHVERGRTVIIVGAPEDASEQFIESVSDPYKYAEPDTAGAKGWFKKYAGENWRPDILLVRDYEGLVSVLRSKSDRDSDAYEKVNKKLSRCMSHGTVMVIFLSKDDPAAADAETVFAHFEPRVIRWNEEFQQDDKVFWAGESLEKQISSLKEQYQILLREQQPEETEADENDETGSEVAGDGGSEHSESGIVLP